jgi:O-antigen ligase
VSDPRTTADRRTTATGVAVFVGAAAWSGVCALVADPSSPNTALLVAGAGVVLALCWAAAARWPVIAAAGVVGAAVGVLLADPAGLLRTGPRQGPFGYANATAAFAAQACVAALLLALVAHGALRIAGVAAAAGFGVAILTTRSWAAAIALPVTLVVAVVVGQTRGGRAAVAACGGLVVAALVATVFLGAWARGGPFDRVLDETIGETRVVLWHDALVLTSEHPVLGVGPGNFATASPIAASDPDLRWAHNEFLQSGAETGLLGYALVAGLFLWGFLALGAGVPGRAAVLSAAGLATLGIHASVDYVLHFPFVALVGAAVVGLGLGATRAARREPTESAEPAPIVVVGGPA